MNVKTFIKDNLQVLQFMAILITLVAALAGLYVASITAPINQSLAVVASELKKNDETDSVEHATFVTKEQILPRLDRIENKVDLLLGR